MRLMRILGLLVFVVGPILGLFFLFSRVRFWFNERKGGKLDAEWKEVGLIHSRYRVQVPSSTPTMIAHSMRKSHTLSAAEVIRRTVLDPALELQLWEVMIITISGFLGLFLFNALCPSSQLVKIKSHDD